MKFAFYGDSWCYHWMLPQELEKISKSIENNYKGESKYEDMLPTESHFLYGMLLRSLGHSAISFGAPCAHMEYVIHQVEESTAKDADIHVVFLSSVIRELSHEGMWDKVPENIKKDHDKFIEFYENKQLRLIWKLNKIAEQDNLRILLIGGHGVISDKAADSTNELITVLSKDILKDLYLERNPDEATQPIWQYPHYFRMCTDIDFEEHDKKGWDINITKRMVKDIGTFITLDGTSHFCTPPLWPMLYPDGGHPNGSTQFNILNKILLAAEEIISKRPVV